MHFTTNAEYLNDYFRDFVDFAMIADLDESAHSQLDRYGISRENEVMWGRDVLNWNCELNGVFKLKDIKSKDAKTPAEIYAERENAVELNDFLNEFRIVK